MHKPLRYWNRSNGTLMVQMNFLFVHDKPSSGYKSCTSHLSRGCPSFILHIWVHNEQSTYGSISDFARYCALGFPLKFSLRLVKLEV